MYYTLSMLFLYTYIRGSNVQPSVVIRSQKMLSTQRWASGRHIATCGDRSKISVMKIIKNDHSEHLKVAICGDRTHFACPPLSCRDNVVCLVFNDLNHLSYDVMREAWCVLHNSTCTSKCDAWCVKTIFAEGATQCRTPLGFFYTQGHKKMRLCNIRKAARCPSIS